MMQAGSPPASLYGFCFSVIKFQRQLYVPRRRGASDLSHRRAETHIWCVELNVVEGVDKVASELQPEPLCKLEVLVQTQINVRVVGRAQAAELRCAVTE